MMRADPNFRSDQNLVNVHSKYRNKQTLVIDIMETIFTRVDLKTRQELDTIMESNNYKSEYVMVENHGWPLPCPCGFPDCVCGISLFRLRPHTFQFLRSL